MIIKVKLWSCSNNKALGIVENLNKPIITIIVYYKINFEMNDFDI
jgi:hypothetical protein